MKPIDPHCRHAFGITLLNARHPEVRRLKRRHPTHLHGNKTWGAGFLLMDYLGDNPPDLHSHIADIGCGWGLAGIFCARHFAAEVTAIDADAGVFPYLQLHADYNDVEIRTRQSYFEDITTEQLQGFDWLLAADICFWDEQTDTVFDLVARACDAGVGKIVIADPQRPPFMELAERCADAFYGEIELRTLDYPRRARGALLVIENR